MGKGQSNGFPNLQDRPCFKPRSAAFTPHHCLPPGPPRIQPNVPVVRNFHPTWRTKFMGTPLKGRGPGACRAVAAAKAGGVIRPAEPESVELRSVRGPGLEDSRFQDFGHFL